MSSVGADEALCKTGLCVIEFVFASGPTSPERLPKSPDDVSFGILGLFWSSRCIIITDLIRRVPLATAAATVSGSTEGLQSAPFKHFVFTIFKEESGFSDSISSLLSEAAFDNCVVVAGLVDLLYKITGATLTLFSGAKLKSFPALPLLAVEVGSVAVQLIVGASSATFLLTDNGHFGNEVGCVNNG